MRYLCSVMGACITAALLAACGGMSDTLSPSDPVPQQHHFMGKRSTSPCPCLYVANTGSNAVTVYPIGATGNVKPIQTISGSRTGLIDPTDVGLDASGNIYVANVNGEFNDSVTVYAAGSNGNVSPIRTIAGSNTTMNYIIGVALDSSENLYVTNGAGGPSGQGAITVYSAGATGNVAPVNTITGSNTGLDVPYALALDTSNNIYVPNFNSQTITVYSAGATGNVAPIQTIGGHRTRLYDNEQVAVGGGSIYTAGALCNCVTSFPVGAHGNVAPSWIIHGRRTKLSNPAGVAVDASENVYVVNGGPIIAVYAPGTGGNVEPIRTIKGARTKLDSPGGIAIQ